MPSPLRKSVKPRKLLVVKPGQVRLALGIDDLVTYSVEAFHTGGDPQVGVTWKKSNGQSYTVGLKDQENSSCECMGFLKHGHCKHIDASLKLSELGLLTFSEEGEQYDKKAS